MGDLWTPPRKRRTPSAASKARAKFRASAKWKKFRKRLKAERKVDFVTLSNLYTGYQLHHCNLDLSYYEDITNEDWFVCLNKQTHQFIHWIYTYYAKDKNVLKRLKQVLDKMLKLNS